MEFETKTALIEFKKLVKEAYPTASQLHPRQHADLMAFFFAGFIDGCQKYHKGVDSFPTVEGANLFMGEIIEDTIEQGKFIAQSMIRDDFSHEIFKQDLN